MDLFCLEYNHYRILESLNLSLFTLYKAFYTSVRKLENKLVDKKSLS